MTRCCKMKRIGLLLLLLLTGIGAFAHPQRVRGKTEVVKVACVGNSITYGMTIDDPEHNSYPAQLQQMLGSGYLVGNFGKSGATLLRRGHRPYNEQEEYHRAVDFAADIVVIHLGINDTDPRNWPNYRDEFVSDYLRLIDSLRSGNSHAQFYIARLSPIHAQHPRFESGTRNWHTQIQQRIEEVARLSGAQLIDFNEPLLPYPNLIPDNLHPNREGATILARTVYSAITGDFGGLSLPMTYTDGMVLQRGRVILVQGVANRGEVVHLSFAGKTYKTTTPLDGKWAILLPALEASAKGRTLTVETSSRRLVYRDVLVGEVWLASGQSNMAYTMRQSDGVERAKEARDPLLRLYDMKELYPTAAVAWSEGALDSVNRLQYFPPTQWREATPETVSDFSAIAYTFAQRLRDSLDVPVGIICNAIGGSTTESWIDRHRLEDSIPALLRYWRDGDYGQPWARKRAYENIALRAQDRSQRHPYDPTYLYDAAIRPLGQYTIAGVLWYQGESNAHNIELHERLFPMLVDSWRAYWGGIDLPFYFVQLSSMERPSWAHFRDSQRRLADRLESSDVWMTVSSDHGHPTDVHPRAKEPIGHRLALQALCHTYGRSVRGDSPKVESMRDLGDRVEITFDDALGVSQGALRGFEVASGLGLFVPAEATIVGDRTVVLRHSLDKPVRRVRYGYRPYSDANLVGQTGLAVSTFAETL